MRRSKRKATYPLIAQRLEADLPSLPSSRLPSIRELCRTYGVSPVTMMKAAAQLRNKGLIVHNPGKAMRIAGRDSSTGAEESSAAAAVFRFIEDKIRQGAFRAGRQLPKMQHFVSECRASTHTVHDALVKLEKANLIHRIVKKWVAGPLRKPGEQSMQASDSDLSQHPAIIMIITDFYQYRQYADQHQFRSLISSLQTELNAFGIRIIPAMRDNRITSLSFPAGRE
jgi:DNA-binding transcriptional regulator YhcF (GntR family)